MNTVRKKNTNRSIGLELLKQFITNEQLAHHNFYQLDELLAITAYEFRKGRISKEEIQELHRSFGSEFLKNTLHGLGFLKPNGYPGDFLFLDKIYTNFISENPKYRIWDEYVQQNGAPNAVRNRKEYFKHRVKAKLRVNNDINILNVVSGSGRELLELYDSLAPNQKINTKCIEIDPHAILFSKELNKKHQQNIAYVQSNIFRYLSRETYDFIWAAGLFDYVNDKAFVMLLKKFKALLKGGGEILIGNYNEAHNPSRDYMEILGDWHLIHRTEAQLIELAKQAGFLDDEIRVNRMPDNIILYLHIHVD